MRPGANRRDHPRSSRYGRSCLRRFNEARRESPGSLKLGGLERRASIQASMRPGANRRDHDGSAGDPVTIANASMRPGANRRDHTRAKILNRGA